MISRQSYVLFNYIMSTRVQKMSVILQLPTTCSFVRANIVKRYIYGTDVNKQLLEYVYFCVKIIKKTITN